MSFRMFSCKVYLPKATTFWSAMRGSLCHCRASVRLSICASGTGTARTYFKNTSRLEVAAIALLADRAEVFEANEGRKRGSGDQTG